MEEVPLWARNGRSVSERAFLCGAGITPRDGVAKTYVFRHHHVVVVSVSDTQNVCGDAIPSTGMHECVHRLVCAAKQKSVSTIV